MQLGQKKKKNKIKYSKEERGEYWERWVDNVGPLLAIIKTSFYTERNRDLLLFRVTLKELERGLLKFWLESDMF